jgi:serine phosphatase RsbU (regulator of sigma subunit)
MSTQPLLPPPPAEPEPRVSVRRPRALVVGGAAVWGRSAGLDAALEIRRVPEVEASPEIASDPPELVLLDGYLEKRALTGILEAVGRPGSAGRPAVIVVADEGQRTHVEDRLIDHVDEFVNVRRGEEVLLKRVRAALRVRGWLEELARKNAELLELNARVEAMAHRLAEELRLASHVQRSLLPPPLHHPNVDLAAEFIPVREIGGDYYDLVPLEPSRLAFAIGDVMGKGVPAALLAANLKTCLRAHLHEGGLEPEDLIGRVNRLFWDVTPKGLFASLFFGIFDFDAGVLEYVNAGHDHPFRVRVDGEVECLESGGTVLGLLENARYERGRIELSGQDLMVFYSDGITDRANPAGEMFGVDRLKEAAVRTRHDGARLTLYSLLGEVQGWSGGAAAEDDMTLIVARVR